MRYSCIIPNYNGGKKLIRTVNYCLSYCDEVIVVDDASNDPAIARLKKNKNKKLKVFVNKKNKGASFSRNFGAKKARYKNLFFIDSDCYLDKKNFLKLIKHQKDIVFPRIKNSNGEDYNNFEPHQDYIQNSVCFLMEKKVFFEVGGFDEKIKIYMDDVEFFYRCKQKGLSIRFVKSSIGTHDTNEKTPESISNSFFANTKNTMYFCLKHHRGFFDNTFPNLFTVLLQFRRAILNKDRIYGIHLTSSRLRSLKRLILSLKEGVLLYYKK